METYIYKEVMSLATVEIVTSDGTIHKNPQEIKIIRSERTELFFQILEDYETSIDNYQLIGHNLN